MAFGDPVNVRKDAIVHLLAFGEQVGWGPERDDRICSSKGRVRQSLGQRAQFARSGLTGFQAIAEDARSPVMFPSELPYARKCSRSVVETVQVLDHAQGVSEDRQDRWATRILLAILADFTKETGGQKVKTVGFRNQTDHTGIDSADAAQRLHDRLSAQ
jgi:hypothetical protein